MAMKHLLLILPLVCSTPVWAEEACPAAPDYTAEKNALYADLRVARDATEAQILSQDLWRIWLEAPDPKAQQMLDDGIGLNTRGFHNDAAITFSALIAYCPDYAEGYNQRAYAAFLNQDFE